MTNENGDRTNVLTIEKCDTVPEGVLNASCTTERSLQTFELTNQTDCDFYRRVEFDNSLQAQADEQEFKKQKMIAENKFYDKMKTRTLLSIN